MADWAPQNYNIDVKSPFDSVLQGYQAGAAIRNDQQQQAQLQQQRDAQLQMQQDLAKLAANPTAHGIVQAGIKYPQLSEQLKRSYDAQSSEEQQASLGQASKVVSAISAGDTDLAKSILQETADAAKNSGDQKKYDGATALLKILELHPESALTTGAMYLAQGMGAKEFTAAYGGILDQFNKQKKAPLENQKLQEDITSEQYKRQIDALDTQIKQANSETERGKLQLERDKLTQESQLKLKDQQISAQSNLDSVNLGLSTVDKILKHPLWDSNIGVGSTIGKIASNIPGTDNKDFDVLLSTLKSQQFLNGIQALKNASKTGASGMGALSETEGNKIESAVASIDRNQSPAALKTALGVIKSTLQKSQKDIIGSKQLPQSGGSYIATIPRFGIIDEGRINKILTENPGATREQTIQYINSLGGK